MKSEEGTPAFFKNDMDCKTVETPPKVITKLKNPMDIIFELRVDRVIDPFVISIIPSSSPLIPKGKMERKGANHSITMKNKQMIPPTVREA